MQVPPINGTRLIRLLVPRPNRMRRIMNKIMAGTISVITNKSIDGNVDCGLILNTCIVIVIYAIANPKHR